MIIVYQTQGRNTSPKNFVIEEDLNRSCFSTEAIFLLYIQIQIRQYLWDNAHVDILYQYNYNIEQYPLPTILNIM